VKKNRKSPKKEVSKSPLKYDKYAPADQVHRGKSSQSKRKREFSPTPSPHKYSGVHNAHKDFTNIPIGQQKAEKKLTTRRRLDEFQKFYDDKIERLNSKFTDKVQNTFSDILGDEDLHNKDQDPFVGRNFIHKYGPRELDRLKIALRRNVEAEYNDLSKNIMDDAMEHEQRMEAYLFKDKPYFNEQINYEELGLSSPQKVFYHKVVAERTRLRTTQKLRKWFEGDKHFKE